MGLEDSKRFNTPEELLKHLKELSDDFEKVQIMVPDYSPIVDRDGNKILMKSQCCIITLCGGQRFTIHTEDIQMLLNDGLFTRMKIPIELTPVSVP